MKSICQFIICLALLASCGTRSSQPEKLTDIYDKKQVTAAIANGRTKQKDALAAFEKGVEKFRKKNAPDEAIELFIASLKSYPTSKCYFELGNAYASVKSYSGAIACYEMAEQLGFAPVSKLFYNLACAYSLSKNYDASVHYLEYAIEAGYLNKGQIATDHDLDYIRSGGLKYTYESALEGVENPDNIAWEGFQQAFAPVMLPVTFDINTEKQFNSDGELSFQYETYITEMRERARFSRGTGNLYYACGTIEQNQRYRAVVYARAPDPDMGPGELTRYFLASYDNAGKLIDKMEVGGQSPKDSLYKVCTISPNLSITIGNFQNTYTTTVDENGEGHMQIATSELKNNTYFQLNEEGKIISASQPLTAL